VKGGFAMKIVITTPSGNIGRVVVEHLLGKGIKPLIVARNPAKVAALEAKGAEVVVGSHADASVITLASKNANAFFILTPPDASVENIRGYYESFGKPAAEAIRKNNIPFVVHLSSVGADLAEGNGPVAGLHYNETLLNAVAKNIIHLRPAYFMENTLSQISSIMQAGALFTTFPGHTRFPMIATRDIGAVAAERLANLAWSGKIIQELQGPAEISYEDVAQILSEALEKMIKHITIPDSQFVESMEKWGVSRTMASSYSELGDAIVKKRVRFHEPRSPKNSTPTRYEDFAREVFKPAYLAAAQALLHGARR
jgi:uncharacterized protein YbjT (DUF2867 family)